MTILLFESGFSPYRELEAYQNESSVKLGHYGAVSVFVGTMRDFNHGDAVTSMSLEHYPGMAERQLMQIASEAQVRWNLLDVLVIHRVGIIQPGESILLAAAWAVHRGAAFDGCRYIVEELKHCAPFWKKEMLEHGNRWVEGNTCGY